MLMEKNDYQDSMARARNSPYDFVVFQGLRQLRDSWRLLTYDAREVLGSERVKILEAESLRIVKSIMSQGSESVVSVGRHVWQEYVRYLEAKDPLYPAWGSDEFYEMVYFAFCEDKTETQSHLESFRLGKIPTKTDVEFILARLVRKTLLALDITLKYQQEGYNTYFYNTLEYKPIVEIVCESRNTHPARWSRLQGEELTDPWKCLEDAFSSLSPKYLGRGIFHFVKKTAEASILQGAVKEVNKEWGKHGGNASEVCKKLVQGINETLDILSSSPAMRYFGNLKTAYEDTSGLIGAPSLPFGAVSHLIRQVEIWRNKKGIPAYGYLFFLKSGSPLIDLPHIRPPFGPKEPEKQHDALRLVEKSRWLKWKEFESTISRI
jgi:hypothetical protein